MWTRIMRHEWRRLAADRALWSIAALFGLVFGYGIYNGVSWTRFQERTIAAARAEEQARLTSLERELEALVVGAAQPKAAWLDPRAPNVLGGNVGARHAILPPAALAPLSVGQSDLLPYYYTVSIWTNRQSLLQNGEIENPLNLLAGRFDLAFVLVFLLPLLILLLSYNVLSAERERGTLAMTLAQPVDLRSWLWAKVTARALLVFSLAVGISLTGALVGGVDIGAEGVLPSLLLWAGVVAVYVLIWFAVAVAVNAVGTGSAHNAMVLAGLWLALVVVLPAALNIVANVLHPLPSRVEMVNAQREASNQAVARRTELLARYYEDHPEMARAVPLDTTNLAARSFAAQQEVDRQMRAVLERYDRQLAGQREIVGRYRYLSPAILVQEALNDIAGTGDIRFQNFQVQVATLADSWKAFFIPRLFAQTQVQPGDVARLPAFQYLEAPVGDVAGRVLSALAILAGITVAITLVATHALRRYSPVS